jgi:hypothetical protein
MMARVGKPLSELHIPFTDLSSLSAADLLSIDGPKFITKDSKRGFKTLAVLISHDKWKELNHGLFDLNPHKASLSIVDDQAYLTIPVKGVSLFPALWQAKPETGLTIITNRKSRKKASR